jgi:hypothetical protein
MGVTLHLAIRAAEKIVGEQLRLHPDTIIAIVRSAERRARTTADLWFILTIVKWFRQFGRLQSLCVRARSTWCDPDISPAAVSSRVNWELLMQNLNAAKMS